MRRLIFGLIGTIGLLSCTATQPSGSDAKGDLEWTTHGRTNEEQRYVPLDQINADNVSQLGLAWYADIADKGGYQSTPLVVDGKLYMTGPWSKVFAFDAVTGKQLWKFDPQVPRELAATSICCNISNRGAAYWKGKVIIGTIDGRLVALDAKSGQKVWDVQVTDPKLQYSITGAPRVGKGIVYIGQGGGEFYTRGFLSAHDAETGKRLWRFWTVPGDPSKGPEGEVSDEVMPMAAETWKGAKWWEKGGGGTVWDGIVYDEPTNTVVFGTGNGLPWPHSIRSPGGGDNLFTASIVALDAKTGKYKWHYQTTPKDSFDFDNNNPLTVAELMIDGKKKRVVMQAPKNGVFYVIEVATGKVVSADPYVPTINWATGFDKANNWAPIMNPDAIYGTKGFYVIPSQAHVWYPQSYNPQTGLFYFGMRYGVSSFVAEEGGRILGNQMVDVSLGKQPEGQTRPTIEDAGNALLAWDPVNRKVAWKQRAGNGSAGTLSTAGNLVFQGTPGQKFSAFRADTGEQVWSVSTQGNVVPGPISYSIDGVQYVAAISSASTGFSAAAGTNRLLVYKLGGTVELPPAPPPVQQVLNPPADFGDATMHARGKDLYERSCTGCHEGGRMFSGFPDLNYSIALGNAALFKGVVLDGALTEGGMISFRNSLNENDVESIRSYLTLRANELKRNPPRGAGPGGPGGPPAGGPPAGAARGAPAPAPAPAQPAAHQ
ncbi:MAG TPA: PQQ-dependent dehydrogenase, methanol/ethanol family [Steroidobacteraceae bacterium]|nr:PQQ-dependent dehydrogenase, methanol/ethanol family [Steroidobacteraceae bacterium]